MIGVTVLGATGSIGVSTLDVIARHPDAYKVVALTANRDVAKMVEQCQSFRPRYAVMADEQSAEALEQQLRACGSETQVLAGVAGLITVATLPEADCVMAAIVGAAGLLPTLAAAGAGKRILLANKEALVLAGGLFMKEVQKNGAVLLPVDSEHNAIFQCLPPDYEGDLALAGIRQILLTASGGPFRTHALELLDNVTPAEACAHPNWEMGRKISVDSATMMNKGLEVIEARWLFNLEPQQIQVVIHPQSVIHSMVEYVDGSVLAQLGSPDMRTPIANALAWPKRIDAGVERLNLFKVARLDFEEPDFNRFPCLRLAYEALAEGGTATAILNAANEMAVDAFLNGRLRFTAIASVVEQALTSIDSVTADSLDTVLDADRETRLYTRHLIQQVG
ncbi:MAG: 1-deoxy-D-xylulose-5-phosphate reductoisomerase [Pseudomonadota bacterium]|nr:1-deoxy-D-xylulose-5-phosphate reductoisomerase [Pseudomonadota bacterium]